MAFLDFLTGKRQAQDLQNADRDATRYLDEGYGTARRDITAGGDRALGYLSPYMEGGGKANALLGDYLGLNGADAQRTAFSNFATDPGWEASQKAGLNALDRSATARGGLYSGAQMKSLYDYGQKNMLDAYNQRFNALAGVSGQGQQAAGQSAGIAQQTGSQLGELGWGYGATKAGNRINLGNALSATRNIGVQNALNIAGTAARFMNPTPTPRVA